MEIKGHEIIFKAKVGSHAYGTNIEGSDEDFKGIFIQSPESVLEDGYLPQIEVSKDEVYYEIGRFVDLCVRGNPTMLELLFAPRDTVQYFTDYFMILADHRKELLSKQLKYSFGGYAIDQIKKAAGLDKKMNWEDERKIRKDVLDFCYVIDVSDEYNPNNIGSKPVKDWLKEIRVKQEQVGLSAIDHFRYTYNVFIDYGDNKEIEYKGIVRDLNKSNDISLSFIPKDEWRMAIMYFNKDGYSVHCKEYASYETWLKERNVQRYVDIEGHGQRIDGKNMLHCVRLLETAEQIAKEGKLVVRRPNAKYLISIRKGQVSLEEIIKNAQSKIDNLDSLFQNSNLPEKSNGGLFKEIVKNIRKKFYEKNKNS